MESSLAISLSTFISAHFWRFAISVRDYYISIRGKREVRTSWRNNLFHLYLPKILRESIPFRPLREKKNWTELLRNSRAYISSQRNSLIEVYSDPREEIGKPQARNRFVRIGIRSSHSMHRRSQTFTLASKILPKFSHRINVDAMNYKRLQRFRRIIGGDAPLIIESTYRSQQSCAPSSIFISIQWYIFAVNEGSSRQVLIERAASAWTSSVFPDVYETSEVRLRNVRNRERGLEVTFWFV